jgi:hypothetical protein
VGGHHGAPPPRARLATVPRLLVVAFRTLAHAASAPHAQNDFTSRNSLRSIPSGASMDAMAAATAAAHHNMKAASCLTHLLSYFGGGPGGACAPGGEETQDEVAARMRRSMSSRGQDAGSDGASHAHGGVGAAQPQYR